MKEFNNSVSSEEQVSATTTATENLDMDTNWTYRYLVDDEYGKTVYCRHWTYSTKEEAMDHLKKDYADDASGYETTEAFFSDSRAWRSTQEGLHIQYDVFNVESK